MKKWTVKTATSQQQPVVSAKTKKEAFEKIKEYRPETKSADVVTF
jgi:hypothetical protein